VLYISLITFASAVLSSVVEEKASRVVELLLVTVPARRILAGKLLGIGVLGIVPIVAVGAAAPIGRVATGKGSIPAAGAQIFALSLLWFLLGYALFSAGYAVLGSLVSRQEDTASAQGPMTVVLVISYIAASAALGTPDGTVAQVCTFIPFTAPMVVLARVVLGHVSPPQTFTGPMVGT
jgi:ABC-2 type transport system permease protein